MCAALETYFARSLGFALLALGLIVVVLSGALPLDASSDGTSTLLPDLLTVFLTTIFRGILRRNDPLALRLGRRPHIHATPRLDRLLLLRLVCLDSRDWIPTRLRWERHLCHLCAVLHHVCQRQGHDQPLPQV